MNGTLIISLEQLKAGKLSKNKNNKFFCGGFIMTKIKFSFTQVEPKIFLKNLYKFITEIYPIKEYMGL